ncbi:hypothetical protein Bca101_084940 [Brassica carinata]
MLRSPLFLLQSIVSSNLQTTGDASLISPLLPLRRPLLPSLRFSCVHGVTELRFLQSDSTHCFTFDLASAQVHSVAWNSNRTKLASGSVDQTARVNYSPCSSPSGIDPREQSDPQLGSMMFYERREMMMMRRKLEKETKHSKNLALKRFGSRQQQEHYVAATNCFDLSPDLQKKNLRQCVVRKSTRFDVQVAEQTVLEMDDAKETARLSLRRGSARLRAKEAEPCKSFHERDEVRGQSRQQSATFDFQEPEVTETLSAADAGCYLFLTGCYVKQRPGSSNGKPLNAAQQLL